MKKVLFTFCMSFVMLWSYNINGQEKLNLDEYKTNESQSISKSELLKKHPELDAKEDYKNAEKLVLKNGVELFKWDNTKDGYTYDYVLNDKGGKDLLFFHTKIVKNKSIEVFDSKEELLYTIDNVKDKGEFNLNLQLRAANCFRECMDESEEAVVDGLIGWMAWNLSPGVQLAAAIRCEWNC